MSNLAEKFDNVERTLYDILLHTKDLKVLTQDAMPRQFVMYEQQQTRRRGSSGCWTCLQVLVSVCIALVVLVLILFLARTNQLERVVLMLQEDVWGVVDRVHQSYLSYV